MSSHDITWHHMTPQTSISSHELTWHHMTSWAHMTSHDITWHHMTSISSHELTWHHMTSHDITSSHELTWHHMSSHELKNVMESLSFWNYSNSKRIPEVFVCNKLRLQGKYHTLCLEPFGSSIREFDTTIMIWKGNAQLEEARQLLLPSSPPPSILLSSSQMHQQWTQTTLNGTTTCLLVPWSCTWGSYLSLCFPTASTRTSSSLEVSATTTINEWLQVTSLVLSPHLLVQD